MGQDSVDRFLGRLITDDAFRKAVVKDFDRACYTRGFFFSDSERDLIKKTNFNEFSRMASLVNHGLRRGDIDTTGFR